MSLPDHQSLSDLLYRQGLSRKDARRMAEEWLAHQEDLTRSASNAAGQPVANLGSTSLLLDAVAALPAVQVSLAERKRLINVARWGGAGIGGLFTTVFLFAAMNNALGL